MMIVNKLAFALGLLLAGNYALAHGHHSHGAPLTEMEQKAAEGIFDDNNVKDRSSLIGRVFGNRCTPCFKVVILILSLK